MWQVPATLPGPRLRFPAAWLFNDSQSPVGQWEAPLTPARSVSHIFGNVCTPPFCAFQDKEGLTFSAPSVLAGMASLPSSALRSAPPVGTPPHPPPPLFFCSSWVSPQILPCKQASVSLSRAIKQNQPFCYPALLYGEWGGGAPLAMDWSFCCSLQQTLGKVFLVSSLSML